MFGVEGISFSYFVGFYLGGLGRGCRFSLRVFVELYVFEELEGVWVLYLGLGEIIFTF